MPQFNEADHPRKSNGQFGSGGGGASSSSSHTEERRESSNTIRKAHGLQGSALKPEYQKSESSSLTEQHRESSNSMRKAYGLGETALKRGYLSQSEKTTNKLKAGAEAAVHEKIPRGRFYSNLRNEGYTPEQANEAVEHYDRIKKASKGSKPE
jgi:hypothetical protein